MQVNFPNRYLEIKRQSVKSTLPLRERLSLRVTPSSWSRDGASFNVKLPSTTTLMGAKVTLYQRFKFDLTNDFNALTVAGAIYPRNQALLRGMSECSCVINGTSISIRPDEIVDPFVFLSKPGRKGMDYDNAHPLGNSPWTGLYKPADGTAYRPDRYESGAEVSRRVKIMQNGGDHRNDVAVAERANGYDTTGTNNHDVLLQTDLPCPPFSQPFECLEKLCESSQVLAHISEFRVDYTFDTTDAFRKMFKCVGHDSHNSVSWIVAGDVDAVAFATDTLWQDRSTAAGTTARLYQPFLEIEYYELPNMVSIPEQISYPGYSYQRYTSTQLEIEQASSKQFSILNVKVEELAPLVMIYCQPTKAVQAALKATLPEAGIWAKPVFSTLQITSSTRSNIMSRLSQKEAYKNYKQLCPQCCVSEQEWYDKFPCIVVDSSQFFQPENVYNPATISVQCKFNCADYAVGDDNYEMVLLMVRPTAVNISEGSCSISNIRVSKESYEAALSK